MDIQTKIQKHKDTISGLSIFVETSATASIETKKKVLKLIEKEKESLKILIDLNY